MIYIICDFSSVSYHDLQNAMLTYIPKHVHRNEIASEKHHLMSLRQNGPKAVSKVIRASGQEIS